jgi:hypothetical protein
MAILGLMVWQADTLTKSNWGKPFFYIALLLFSLSVVAFLFGALGTFESRKGREVSAKSKTCALGIGFALSVLGGLALAPGPSTFPVTVFVHSERGVQDTPLLNQNYVVLDLGPDRRQEAIGDRGQAHFPAVPATFRGQLVAISISHASVYEPVVERVRLDTSVYLPVRQRGDKVIGYIEDTDGHPVQGATVEIAGLSTMSDASGRFELFVPGTSLVPGLQLRVARLGFTDRRVTYTPRSNEPRIQLDRAP